MKSYQSIYQRFIWLIVFSLSYVVQAQELLLTNANIVDPKTEQIRQGHLLIENEIITATLQTIPENFTGQIIDIKDKWIIPGLNELHTHAGGNRAPGRVSEHFGTTATVQLLLSVGVTSLLDLFGDETELYTHRKLLRDGKIAGADLFTSLSCLTATKGHCTEYGIDTRTMDSPEEAISVVNDLAKKSPDVIKMVYTKDARLPTISNETLIAAINAAKKQGIKTVVHINSLADMRDVIAAKADVITHLPSNEEVTIDIAKAMAKNNVAIIPTVVSDTDAIDFITQPSLLETPMASYLVSDLIRSAYSNVSLKSARIEELQKRNEMFYRSLKTLSDAGVTLLTGSDSGGSGTMQGYSLHRELVKFVHSGLTSWQALQASTTNAGQFLGKKFGVNSGDEANLVILQASPIEEISNTQRVAFVIHHGKVIQSFLSK
jgi:imidazolonepropionase-like amidohydrolase